MECVLKRGLRIVFQNVRVGWNHTSAVVCITAYFQSWQQYMVCYNELCVVLRLAGMTDGRQ
jgi:hypothetical protein